MFAASNELGLAILLLVDTAPTYLMTPCGSLAAP